MPTDAIATQTRRNAAGRRQFEVRFDHVELMTATDPPSLVMQRITERCQAEPGFVARWWSITFVPHAHALSWEACLHEEDVPRTQVRSLAWTEVSERFTAAAAAVVQRFVGQPNTAEVRERLRRAVIERFTDFMQRLRYETGVDVPRSQVAVGVRLADSFLGVDASRLWHLVEVGLRANGIPEFEQVAAEVTPSSAPEIREWIAVALAGGEGILRHLGRAEPGTRLSRPEVQQAARAQAAQLRVPTPRASSPPHVVAEPTPAPVVTRAELDRIVEVGIAQSPALGASYVAHSMSEEPGIATVTLAWRERGDAQLRFEYDLRGILDGRAAASVRFRVRGAVEPRPSTQENLPEPSPSPERPSVVVQGREVQAIIVRAREIATRAQLVSTMLAAIAAHDGRALDDLLQVARMRGRATWSGGRREGDARVRERAVRTVQAYWPGQAMMAPWWRDLKAFLEAWDLRANPPAATTISLPTVAATLLAPGEPSLEPDAAIPVLRADVLPANQRDRFTMVVARCTACEGEPLVRAVRVQKSSRWMTFRFDHHEATEELRVTIPMFDHFMQTGERLRHDLFLPENELADGAPIVAVGQ